MTEQNEQQGEDWQWQSLHNRRALIHITPDNVCTILGLGDRYAPVAFFSTPYSDGILIKVVSPDLPEVEADTESPRIDGNAHIIQVTDDQGRNWQHIAMDPEGWERPTFEEYAKKAEQAPEVKQSDFVLSPDPDDGDV